MKIVKLNIYDIKTACHHGRLVIEARTGEVIEAFIARDENHGKGALYSPDDWGYIENILVPTIWRFIRLYKLHPSRVAFARSYVLDDPSNHHWTEDAYFCHQ